MKRSKEQTRLPFFDKYIEHISPFDKRNERPETHTHTHTHTQTDTDTDTDTETYRSH